MYFMNNDYTISEILKMGYSFVLTKIFNKDALLIRRPFYLRGGKRCRLGKGFTTGYRCRLETFGEKDDRSPKLIIKENVRIGDSVHIAAAEYVEIGRNCLFASKILISDLDHGDYSNDGTAVSAPCSDPSTRVLKTAPVIIGDNVWIGDNACILKGVNLGKGCIVASNSVVTRDVEPATMVAGVPARPIKRYNEAQEKWLSIT